MTTVVAARGDELGKSAKNLIERVKRRLGFNKVDDIFDDLLEQRLRGIQMIHGLTATGYLDTETIEAIGLVGAIDDE